MQDKHLEHANLCFRNSATWCSGTEFSWKILQPSKVLLSANLRVGSSSNTHAYAKLSILISQPGTAPTSMLLASLTNPPTKIKIRHRIRLKNLNVTCALPPYGYSWCRSPLQGFYPEHLDTIRRGRETGWKYTTQSKIQDNSKNWPGIHHKPI